MSNIHKNFNSRTRVGATRHILHRQARYQFQFTHPCGCDWGLAAMDGNPSGFNSRTRVGATPGGCGAGIFTRFNSRTRVGATSPMRAFGGTRMFQFTHPCGCDQALTLITKLIRVPIHAPVWVRRGAAESRRLHIPSFNSRTRVGATLHALPRRIRRRVSIHAPVWVRRHTLRTVRRVRGFQFTHPCGCDSGFVAGKPG